jgi:hypothetical protein
VNIHFILYVHAVRYVRFIESRAGGEVVEVYTATLREHLPLVHAALLAERGTGDAHRSVIP